MVCRTHRVNDSDIILPWRSDMLIGHYCSNLLLVSFDLLWSYWILMYWIKLLVSCSPINVFFILNMRWAITFLSSDMMLIFLLSSNNMLSLKTSYCLYPRGSNKITIIFYRGKGYIFWSRWSSATNATPSVCGRMPAPTSGGFLLWWLWQFWQLWQSQRQRRRQP